MSEVVSVIPVRSGSKGVTGKDIKHLADKPLIAYSVATAKLANDTPRKLTRGALRTILGCIP